MRKTITYRKGNSMLRGGLGRYGPYAQGIQKTGKHTYVKASVGTRGNIIGIKHTKRGTSTSLEHNLTTSRTNIKLKFSKAKIKFRL